jgi:predicted nucleic acid-binding protein
MSHLYQKKQKYKFKWDINNLENKDKKKDYQEHITEELKKIERKQDVNEEWISIKNVILETVKVEIGEQWTERNQDWYDEETQIAMKEKNDARKKCLNNETRRI